MTEYIVYRLFDDDNELLYVGSTTNIGRRIGDHVTGTSWWCDVVNVEIERHDDVDSMTSAERFAIQTERPRHNRQLSVVTPIRPHMHTRSDLDGVFGPPGTVVRPREFARHRSQHERTVHRWIKHEVAAGRLERVSYGKYVVTPGNDSIRSQDGV